MNSIRNKFLITTSWDDGSRCDIKLSILLLKYKIPATFYIPGNCELSKSQINNLSKNFEIGGHTKTHKTLTKISINKAEKEINRNKNEICFCYPRGKYNQDIKQLVGFSGYKYARTTKIFSGILGDKLAAPTSVHAFSHFYIDWEMLACVYFNLYKKFGGVFHLWGHSWEIEKNKDWDKLERVLKYISKNSKASQRFTNGEIAESFQESKKKYYTNIYK